MFDSVHWYTIAGLLCLTLLALLLAARFLPPAVDWGTVYRPAALAFLRTGNPYVRGFMNPPWAIIPLLPFALLPEPLGRATLTLVTLAAFAFAAHRLGAGRLATAVFLLSPPVMHCTLNLNVDWLVILGFALPPRWGLFLVLVKPQVGACLALFWLAEAWREGGWRRAVRMFWPVTLTLALCLALYGPWPLRWLDQPAQFCNTSLWPLSLPVGLALMVAALRLHNARLAMLAGPCLSPYVVLYSWAGALLAVADSTPELAAAVAGLWVLCGMAAR